MEPTAVLATVTGRDRPGVASSLFAVLAGHDVEVRDVAQFVIRDRLLLTVLLDVRGEVGPLRDAVQRTASAFGMEAEVVRAGLPRPHPSVAGVESSILVTGRPLRPGAIGAIAARITDLGANIDTIRQVSAEPTVSLELTVTAPDSIRLRRVLVDVCADNGVEMAVTDAARSRLAARAVLLGIEAIVLIDPAAGDLAAIAATGRRDGEPGHSPDTGDTAELAARLAGTSVADLASAAARVRVHPGASAVVAALHRHGYRVGLVSGGLAEVADALVDRLGLDFAAANRAEELDGMLTGRLIPPVLDPPGRAETLRRFAAAQSVPLEQTVAVGTGRDDLDLIEQAGIGVVVDRPRIELPAGSPGRPVLACLLTALGINEVDPAPAASADPTDLAPEAHAAGCR